MKGPEFIQRCRAIGVTFSRSADGSLAVHGSVNPPLWDFINGWEERILKALEVPEPIDLAAERARRRRGFPHE